MDALDSLYRKGSQNIDIDQIIALLCIYQMVSSSMSSQSRIIDFVRNMLSESNQGAHTLDHTMRVFSLCLRLSEGLQVNRRVLEAASLLHDIGRPQEISTGISHSIVSGQMSRGILTETGYSEREIEQVVAAIRTHRFSEGIEPTSLEGEILSDADKIDAIGAIGIYRAIAQAATSDRGIRGFLQHADEKLLKLKDLMCTTPGKQLAAERHEILSRYVEELRQEMESDEH